MSKQYPSAQLTLLSVFSFATTQFTPFTLLVLGIDTHSPLEAYHSLTLPPILLAWLCWLIWGPLLFTPPRSGPKLSGRETCVHIGFGF